MEHRPMDLVTPPTDITDALAVLDFLLGDEWAGLTEQYATEHAIEAIQVLESFGAFGLLPKKYHQLRERLLA